MNIPSIHVANRMRLIDKLVLQSVSLYAIATCVCVNEGDTQSLQYVAQTIYIYSSVRLAYNVVIYVSTNCKCVYIYTLGDAFAILANSAASSFSRCSSISVYTYYMYVLRVS